MAVDEHLHVGVGDRRSDGGDVVDGQLPRQHHRPSPEGLRREPRAVGIRDGHLRRRVERQGGRDGMQPGRETNVLHNQTVDAGGLGGHGEFLGLLHFRLEHQHVDAHVALEAGHVQALHELWQLLDPKVHSPRASIEASRATKVDGVGSCLDSRFNLRPTACWRQQDWLGHRCCLRLEGSPSLQTLIEVRGFAAARIGQCSANRQRAVHDSRLDRRYKPRHPPARRPEDNQAEHCSRSGFHREIYKYIMI